MELGEYARMHELVKQRQSTVEAKLYLDWQEADFKYRSLHLTNPESKEAKLWDDIASQAKARHDNYVAWKNGVKT